MTPWIFNCSIAVGVACVGVGSGLIYPPAGLIATGALILVLTFAALRL